MTWKYAMIKVGEESHIEEYPDGHKIETDDICELVELYGDNQGNYMSFAKPIIASPNALRTAYRQVEKDGINTWFWNNGKFSWDAKSQFWDWRPQENIGKTCSNEISHHYNEITTMWNTVLEKLND